MADVANSQPVKYPSSTLVRRLSLAASVLTAGAIASQAAVKILQQTGKSKAERAGLEGAVGLTMAVTLARAVPSLLSEIRNISRQLQR